MMFTHYCLNSNPSCVEGCENVLVTSDIASYLCCFCGYNFLVEKMYGRMG